MPPREEACLCINQEHFLSAYPLMQQRNAGKWPADDFLPRASPWALCLQRGIICWRLGSSCTAQPRAGENASSRRGLEILIKKSIPSSLPFPPIWKMSPFTWVKTSCACTMTIWRRRGTMVSDGGIICWNLGFSIGTSSITGVRVWKNQNRPKKLFPEESEGWRWSHPALPDLSDSEKFAS